MNQCSLLLTAFLQLCALSQISDEIIWVVKPGDHAVVTEDARWPFEDESFDLVTSSLVIHNIHRRGGREKAILEAVRVLAPGGRLVITDIQVKLYPALLTKLGMNSVAIRSLDWRFWWGGPFFPTQLVTATKPIARSIGPI